MLIPHTIIDPEKGITIPVEELTQRYSPSLEDGEDIRELAYYIYEDRIERNGEGSDKTDWYLAIKLMPIRRYREEIGFL